MKFLKILAVIVGSLFVTFVGFGLYTGYQAHYYQSTLGSQLERELGFTHGSPYLRLGDDSREVFTLHPTPGGVLADAGIRDGDIVLGHTITNFYRLLHERRGSSVTVRVTDGGNGPPIAQRPIRSVTFSIPSLRPTQ